MCEEPQGKSTETEGTTEYVYCADTNTENLIIGQEGMVESEKALYFAEIEQASDVGEVVTATTKFLHRLLRYFGPMIAACPDCYHDCAKNQLKVALTNGGYLELPATSGTDDYFCIYTGTYVNSKEDCKPIILD